jgi:hypothetical protein
VRLEIRETYVNATKEHGIGDSGWYEPWASDRGELFRSLQKEYGRCVSRMYRDIPGGSPPVIAVGWVFQGNDEYEDARPSWTKERRTYLREVWVEVREKPDDDQDDQDQETGS